jgi:phosphoglycolate phosphatase
MSQFQAVLFDFDGTLADSFEAIAASVNHVRGVHGLAPLPEPEVRRHVGLGADHLLLSTVPGCNVATALSCYRAHHPSVMQTHTRLLPGANAVIQALSRAGVRLGVCSNKPAIFTLALLKHLHLLPPIEVVLGPEDVPFPKPHPVMLLHALHQLDCPLDRALYIGDMRVDIQAARAAGVQVWVVPTGTESEVVLRGSEPDRVLESLHEVLSVLRLGG